MSKIVLTKQQWFDAAWERAKTKKRSQNYESGGLCTYDKTVNGGCFIGAAMPDNRFADISSSAGNLVFRGDGIAVKGYSISESQIYLDALQAIHDSSRPHQWQTDLVKFAYYWGVSIPKVESLPLFDLEYKYTETPKYRARQDGYGNKIPTDKMVRFPNEKQWRRVYAICWSNAATHYIIRDGERVVLY